MSLRFILGRSGSGKTHRCLEEIAQETRQRPLGPPLLLLAPDQATYQLERDLLTVGKLQAYTRPEILSFQRLAYRILESSGGIPAVLSAVGRRVVLARFVKTRSKELSLFGRNARHPGFFEQLDRLFRELLRYGVTPDALRETATRAHDDPHAPAHIAAKLNDLAVLTEAYREDLGHSYLDPDYTLTLAEQRLGQCQHYQGAQIWLDGFAELTPQQFKLLRCLMRVAKTTTVALNVDPKQLRPDTPPQENLFATTVKTYDRFLEAGGEERLARGEDVLLDRSPRYHSPALAAVERLTFLSPEISDRYEETPSGLTMLEAPNRRSEIAWIARDILRAARHGKLRFRTMALVLRDIELYEAHIREIFGALEIPCFIDRRRDIIHHPLVELVRCAVELARGGWRRDPLFRYLRTGFLDGLLQPVDVDRLELHVIRRGLEGRRWSRDELWTALLPTSEEEYDETPNPTTSSADALTWRATVEEPLQPLFKALQAGEISAAVLVEKLETLFERLEITETLERWRTEAGGQNELGEAQEHEQAYRGVRDVLEQLRLATGSTPLPVRTFAELLDVGLRELTLGFVPPGLDQVLVGSIERSRQPQLHTVYLPGFEQDAYPKRHPPGGLLADDDRVYLEEKGLPLAPSTKEASHGEPYIAYVAMTRASDRLVVSYPVADDGGRRINPSPYVADLQQRFPTLQVTQSEREHEMPPADPQSIATFAGVNLDTKRPRYGVARALEERLASDARVGPVLELVRRARSSVEPVQLERRVRGLFGEGEPSFSVSRLERFAACPFQHFAKYGLGLEALKPFQLESRDLGSLAHDVLAQLFGEWIEKETSWRDVERPEALESLERLFEAEIKRAGPEFAAENARSQAIVADLRTRLERLVRVMLDGAQETAFEPWAAEYPLEKSAFQLEVDKTPVRLVGRVDRVDIAAVMDKQCVRAIDYKMTGRNFDWPGWYAGLQLQLATYLLAVSREGEGREPVGAFYLPIRPPAPKGNPKNRAEPGADRLTETYKHAGFYAQESYGLLDESVEPGKSSSFFKLRLTNPKKGEPKVHRASSDPIQTIGLAGMLQHTEKCLVDLSRRVLQGDIAVHPYKINKKTPCEYCDYASVCRFDSRVDEYRRIPKRTAKEIRTELEEAAND